MTNSTVPNSKSVLQPDSALPPQQLGRRAYGHQRRMSQATIARNIAESIITHRELGDNRPISQYTDDPNTQALVQAQLESLALAAGEVA